MKKYRITFNVPPKFFVKKEEQQKVKKQKKKKNNGWRKNGIKLNLKAEAMKHQWYDTKVLIIVYMQRHEPNLFIHKFSK